MTVYLLLFAAIALMMIVYYNKNAKKEQFNKIFTVMIFAALVLIIGLRHPTMGHDLRYGATNGYLGSFDIIADMSWLSVLDIKEFLNYERGFIIYCKLVSTIWNNQQFFLFSSAFLSLFPIFLLIYKKSENAIMSSLIYMGVPAFLIIYSGIRQGIAIGICALALLLLQNKKIFWFIVTVLLAWTFHSSSIVFIVALPLYFIRFNKVARWISVGILPVVYIFRQPLFDLISSFIDESASAYDQSAITLFLVFCAIYVFCIVFNSKSTPEYNGLMNIFYVACLCQAFGGVHNLAMRVGYYFMMALIMLLPHLVSNMKIVNNSLLSNLGINSAFAAYAFYSIYSSTWAMANPYYFFWETVL